MYVFRYNAGHYDVFLNNDRVMSLATSNVQEAIQMFKQQSSLWLLFLPLMLYVFTVGLLNLLWNLTDKLCNTLFELANFNIRA